MDKAIFLDRDGVINRCAPPHEYICRPEDFVFLPGVLEALRSLHDAGYRILVVTNQRGIARGLLTSAELDAVHGYMCAEIEAHGGRIDGIYVCPHEEGTCDCRKPQIGLFLQAEQDFPIDKASSWMIGDSISDIEAGRRYGVRTIRTSCLPEAASMILEGCA